MAAGGREFGDKYGAEPARAPLPCPPGGRGEGRGRGARALPAAHPPANLERCGRSWLGGRRGCGAGAPSLAGTAPGRRASPAPGNNEVGWGVRGRPVPSPRDCAGGWGGRAGRWAGNAGESLFGSRSYTRCGRGGGVLPPRSSPWRDGRGRGRDAGFALEPPESWRPPALVI